MQSSCPLPHPGPGVGLPALLPGQLLANAPGKAAEDGPGPWAPGGVPGCRGRLGSE